ncbi:MAG: helix-turn-helix transcriptional regulator [Sporolactobacillus sp.]
MSESETQGALTEAVFYILLALHTPLHGYGIMQLVREMSDGRVDLGAGTLYGAINTLLARHWIVPHQADEGSRRKDYVVTDEGRHAVQIEMERLEELLTNGKQIMEGRGDEKNCL